MFPNIANTDNRKISEPRESLQRLVEELAAGDEVALARIWLVLQDSECEICHGTIADGNIPGLHLVASYGQSQRAGTDETWNRITGNFHRFPLHSTKKIGRIGATGEPLVYRKLTAQSDLTNSEWLSSEGIRGFFGYPLIGQGQVLGVLAVFSRHDLSDRDIGFMRQIAESGSRLLTVCNDLTVRLKSFEHSRAEHQELRRELDEERLYGSIVARAAVSRRWQQQIDLFAKLPQPLLIRGGRGVGKEYTARTIHQRSATAPGSFRKIRAASIDDHLLNAWFTEGADAFVKHSTLYLDKIDETPAEVQTRFASYVVNASALIKQEYGIAPKMPRIICSTSTNIDSSVKCGGFSEDLYCALSTAEIVVPSLIERDQDFEDLCEQFLETICSRENRSPLTLSRPACARLKAQPWPGNVRQLRQLLELATWNAVSGVSVLEEDVFNLSQTSSDRPKKSDILREDERKRQERANLIASLERCQGKIYGRGGAAEMLGLKPTTLMYRLKVLGIRKPQS